MPSAILKALLEDPNFIEDLRKAKHVQMYVAIHQKHFQPDEQGKRLSLEEIVGDPGIHALCDDGMSLYWRFKLYLIGYLSEAKLDPLTMFTNLSEYDLTGTVSIYLSEEGSVKDLIRYIGFENEKGEIDHTDPKYERRDESEIKHGIKEAVVLDSVW